jgi:diamine N-acetyltransferase
MNAIDIIKVSVQELELLQQIGKKTFYETFAALNTEENMRQYLDEGFSTSKMVAELKDPNAEFYFAYEENNVFGYLKLNFGSSQTELKDENAVEIERIYVLQEYQGKKVGKMLFEKAVAIAKERHADFIWLGVWEQNHKAISFYEKQGFRTFDKHLFMLGTDEQTDLMMKLELN